MKKHTEVIPGRFPLPCTGGTEHGIVLIQKTVIPVCFPERIRLHPRIISTGDSAGEDFSEQTF